MPSPDVLKEIVSAVGSERTIFSLDMREGEPLRMWESAEPEAFATDPLSPRASASLAIAIGITRLIVLDFARVGRNEGIGTEDLCHQIVAAYPHVDVFAGGGISAWGEIKRLESIGVKGVLVASALHDRRLRTED